MWGGGARTPALIEGQEAYESGLDEDMNPYEDDSLDYAEWELGYFDSMEEKEARHVIDG